LFFTRFLTSESRNELIQLLVCHWLVCFVDRCLSFCTLFAIVLSVLRYTISDYSFGIFKRFFWRFAYIFKYFIQSSNFNDKWNISWSFVTHIFNNGQPSHGGDRKIFEVMTSTLPKGNLGSVASLLAATLYQELPTLPEHLVFTPRF
jgi:hypothetical protein